MFENLKQPNTNAISDMRGIMDFTNLAQFNQFEGGYSIFTVVSIPKFMELLATTPGYSEKYGSLIRTYVKILEQEFKGMSGIDNITADVGEFSNGISNLQMINKVTEQSAGTFSMNFTEKAGAVLTRTHELFLKGIKDTRSGFKHYHGLIRDGLIEPGFDKECFSFMYMVTDNTGYQLEKAYYIIGAQPQNADLSTLYNTDKGNYEFKELSCEFYGFPLVGDAIDAKAKKLLAYLTGRVHAKVGETNGLFKNSEVDGYTALGDDGIYTLNSTDYKGYKSLRTSDENPDGTTGELSGDKVVSWTETNK